jgi:hypothetical protein
MVGVVGAGVRGVVGGRRAEWRDDEKSVNGMANDTIY